MGRLDQRLARLEAAKPDRPRAAGTPEECCAAFGYTLDQALAEFGSFPAFCYQMVIRPDPIFRPTGEGADSEMWGA